MNNLKYNIFFKLIKQKRIDLNIKQKVIADSLKKPQSFISKYETGERRIDLIEFLDICFVLKINPIEFIKELENKFNESK